MTSAAHERLDELLLARATEGLDAADERELTRLLATERDVDAGAYERAAAARSSLLRNDGGIDSPVSRVARQTAAAARSYAS